MSTRGGVASRPLEEALLGGTAPDGGLWVPERLPRGEVRRPTGGALADAAVEVLRPFFEGGPLAAELRAMADEAFDVPAPLVPLRGGDDFLLQLFHGRTAAFKDYGARFLAACVRRLSPAGVRRTVLVATSGDTGGAVAAAFHGMPGVRVVVLYPDGRVSPRQAHQLGAFGSNVAALRVRGSFDDCQRLVKAAFADEALGALGLLSANSISLGRLLPQLAYHAHAAWVGQPPGGLLNLVVPTGNLGNALAAVWARELGAPVGDIVLATNANRTLPDFFGGEAYRPRASVPTVANAMDVGDPSNFERLAWTFGGADAARAALRAEAVDDAEIADVVRTSERRTGRIPCPHTAAGIRVLERLRARGATGRWAVAATAHPAKFETVIEPLVRHPVPVPEPLAELLARPASAHPLAADAAALREWLLADAAALLSTAPEP